MELAIEMLGTTKIVLKPSPALARWSKIWPAIKNAHSFFHLPEVISVILDNQFASS